MGLSYHDVSALVTANQTILNRRCVGPHPAADSSLLGNSPDS